MADLGGRPLLCSHYDILEEFIGCLQAFVTGAFNQALKLDSLSSSHPVQTEVVFMQCLQPIPNISAQKVGDPEEINEIFDTVTYAKVFLDETSKSLS